MARMPTLFELAPQQPGLQDAHSGRPGDRPAGNIHSTPQNRFHDVDGMTETQLMDRIEHHVHRN